VVRFTDFDISLGAPAGPQLLASLNGGPEKVAILDLDLAGVTLAVDGRAITVLAPRSQRTVAVSALQRTSRGYPRGAFCETPGAGATSGP